MRTAHRSYAGGRAANEDCAGYGSVGNRGCWVVADGLGGHAGGAAASRCAVDAVLRAARLNAAVSGEAMLQLVRAANDAIRQAQGAGGPERGMRSTVSVLVSDGRAVMWAHVGDTRVYQFRGGRVARRTLDHSVPQLLADAGAITPDDIRGHRDRSRLLRALGSDAAPRPTIVEQPEPLRAGDAFLLCTDGWWEYVTEPEMEFDLAKAAGPDEWLELMLDRILSRAPRHADNLTAIGVLA